MSRHDKRPAFPGHFHNFGDRNELAPDGQLVAPRTSVQMTGMTIRQLYAGQAMQGYIAASSNCTACGPLEPPEFASAIGRDCWIMADALIATEREAAPELPAALTDAARDVLAERRRQVDVEGFTAERDDKYINCELARAAATYATCSHIEQLKLVGEQVWPWHPEWFKRSNYRDDLVKAGALILAEIERLDRDGGGQ